MHPSAADYDVVRLLGTGAFARVYLARHRSSGDLVALKAMCKVSRHRGGGAVYVDAATELRVHLALSHHPHITTLAAAFASPTHAFLVLEWARGGDLHNILERERLLLEPEARFYLAQTAAALAHLHSMGVIYRDLKPENILIDAHGHVKLADFGLSLLLPLEKKPSTEPESIPTFVKSSSALSLSLASASLSSSLSSLSMENSANPSVSATVTGRAGTTAFMAPEIVLRLKYDHTVDWWALGVTMYLLLTGGLPFHGRSARDVEKSIATATRPVFPRYVSDSARSLMVKLMNRNPSARAGFSEIQKHGFFTSVTDWSRLDLLQAPWNPAENVDATGQEKKADEKPKTKNATNKTKKTKTKKKKIEPTECIKVIDYSIISNAADVVMAELPPVPPLDPSLCAATYADFSYPILAICCQI